MAYRSFEKRELTFREPFAFESIFDTGMNWGVSTLITGLDWNPKIDEISKKEAHKMQ